jgi:tetratricopeptide (TPR) repeat protein
MKRLSFVILLIAALSGTYAQKGKVTSALNLITLNKYEDALKAVQAAETNEKSMGWFRTYYAKGRVMQAIAESGDQALIAKVGNPLEQAYDNYMKAIDMDPKKKIGKEIDLYIASLTNDFVNNGVEYWNNNNYADAYKTFNHAVKLGEMPVFKGAVDTSIIYNAALAAYNAKLYDEAIIHFDRVAKMGYEDVMPYKLIKDAYLAKGDSAAALKKLQEGYEKYPENQAIMIELINYYLMSGKDEEALKYLDVAIEKDPTNASFYYARGVVFDKRGRYDEAVQLYKKALSLNPEDFNTNYNMGAIEFNKGVACANDANSIMDNNEYLKAKKICDEQFTKALPFLEKAHQVDPTETSTMETLKTLYWRLQMTDKYEQMVKQLEEYKK